MSKKLKGHWRGRKKPVADSKPATQLPREIDYPRAMLERLERLPKTPDPACEEDDLL